MQDFHNMNDDFGETTIPMTVPNVIRLLSAYGLPLSLQSQVDQSPINFLARITSMAVNLGGNFKTSAFIDLLKKFDGNPVLLCRAMRDTRSKADFGDLRRLVQKVTGEMQLDDEVGKMNRKLLEEACESHLYVLRYFSTFLIVTILQTFGPINRSITNRLFAILSCRAQDTSAKIRQLANLGGYVENFLLHKSDFVSLDQVALAFKDSFRDPCPSVKMAVLKYVSDTFGKNREYTDQISLFNRALSTEIVSICFDPANPAVSAQALKVLSDPIFGEFLLNGDESKYQALSLLIWKVVWSSTKPQATICKEALKFVNNHVLATPGIFSDKIPASQKIQMVAEFIEQYSDGLVFSSTITFVFAYSANLSVGITNFLTQPGGFEIVIENLVDTIKDQIVRKGTLSSLFAETTAKHDEETEVSHKLRLNTVLELMCNAIVRFGTNEVLSDRVLVLMGDLFECWDEAEEPCQPNASMIGESQVEVQMEAAQNGIRSRRFCFEVLHEMLQLRFSESAIPSFEEDIQEDIDNRVLLFQMTKNAISSSLR